MKSANPEHWDFYRKLRRRIQAYSETGKSRRHGYTEYLLLAPDLFHLCIHLLKDPDVPAKYKARIAFAVAYFISPLDLLPEAVFGPFGYLDDIGLVAFVLNGLINEVPEHVLMRHWAGTQDLFVVIRAIILAADRMLGKGLWLRIKGLLNPSHRSDRVLKDASFRHPE